MGFTVGWQADKILMGFEIFKILSKFNYHIASNYGQSRINAWCRLVVRGTSIITTINAGSRINARPFVDPLALGVCVQFFPTMKAIAI